MLNEIRFGLDHAWDEDFARRQLNSLEQSPFMGVPGIRGLERDEARSCGEDDINDIS